MNLLSAQGISKGYSEKQLLNNINLSINEGDKIGLIGINGTGKTTLLKIIAGLELPDSGAIIKGGSLSVEYLPQNPDFDPDGLVLEQVFKGISPVMKLIREYEEAVSNPSSPPERIMKLSHDMDAMDAWSLESEGKSLLTKLGITGFGRKLGELSGGQRKRAALASALVNPCGLLILDEPTNHLDDDTIEWLEQYLNRRKGALLMVTHDRYFLDRVANGIMELDRGSLYAYKGNYSVFLEKKLEREEMEAAGEKKRQNLYRKELAWIKRGAKARSTKQKARIERFEKLNEQAPDISDEKLEILASGTRLGKKVIELEHIDKSFDSRKIIDDFSYIVLRNDRVGIIGPNGSGKTTLLNIMCGVLSPDSGSVSIGETVKIGMYAQENFIEDETLKAVEYIREGAEYLSLSDGQSLSASQMMERFLFPADLQWTPVSRLSGGEKRRLYLLRVLMEAPNVLLLDEPTNDLDIETLKILEDYLEGFNGAVVSVSHDRYFLDRTAEKIFVFEGSGRITQHTGNYTDYKGTVDCVDDGSRQNEARKASSEASQDESSGEKKRERPLKMSFKEQREFEEIDDCIAGLEDSLNDKKAAIEAASTDYTLLQQLISEKEEIERQLEEKMERWIYLNELSERIGQLKRN
jgi:ATP-binding cassette subfamily F protein uup